MFGFLKSKKGKPPLEGPPHLGENRRVYAIGDVHGRVDLLEKLIDKIAADDWRRPEVEHTTLILLGDYVDRGPRSKQVIDFVLQLRDKWPNLVCLRGNHEQVFQMAIEGDESAVRFFTRPGVGGRETMLSYGADDGELDKMTLGELRDWIVANVPASHKAFLTGLQEQILIGDYAFVHAGIEPGVPMEKQETTDLLWIRDGFLDNDDPHPYMIVHGHSIEEEVQQRVNRIGIDTGAFMTGKLTALGLEGHDQWFLHTGER